MTTTGTERKVTDEALPEPPPGGATGWAPWDLETDRFHGGAIYRTKESLLISYDFMTLGGLDSCEDRMLWSGLAVVPVEVVPGRRGRDSLHTITIGGKISPYGLEWSAIHKSADACLGSAIGLIGSHPELVETGIDPGQAEALRQTPSLQGTKTAKGRRAREKGLAILAALDIGTTPIRIRRIPGGRTVPPVELPQGYRLKRSFRVELAALVDPTSHGPRFLELETYVDLCRTAHRAPHGESGPYELLSGGSCINSDSVDKIGGTKWRDTLSMRFRHVLLRRHFSPAAAAWRVARGIELGRTIDVRWPTAEMTEDRPYWGVDRKPNPTPCEMVDALFGPQADLAWSLNTCWAKAVAVHRVLMAFSRVGAAFFVEYGCRDEKGSPSGSWHQPLAFQRPGEPLLTVVVRARAELARLQDPAADPPIISHRKGLVAKPAPRPGEVVHADTV